MGLLTSPVILATNITDSGLIRIGTGGPKGTYYPIGSLIASAVSDTSAFKTCQTSPCDQPPILAVHQTSNGSIANAMDIQSGSLEAGLVQSDIAHWAFTGTGVLQGDKPAKQLRAVGSLYTESFHLVARKDANIQTVRDLRNKRVSLDEPGSGTLVDATLLLNAYGLQPADLKAEYIKAEIAKSKLLEGRLDAFFIVGGFPVSIIAELAETGKITLVPIDGPEKAGLLSNNQFFSENLIPAGTYSNIGETATIGVGALLLVTSMLEENIVYKLTKELWSAKTRKILSAGHQKGKEIRFTNMNKGVSVPFHPGALRLYSELGVPINP
ncbi:MAG: TAXI family TRAP transporter solute-binding subunit [Acidiferrobacterales bacterium]|nr:TAXI family TRAP transporter solute-binding subunit [Acidiferrobacterales bacterium]